MLDFIKNISDVIGIIGVIILLLGYYLLNMGKIKALSYCYQLMNFSGSFFILISLMYHWNLSAVLIEVAWMLVSMLGIYQVWRQSSL